MIPLQAVLNECGLLVSGYMRVHGGDINEAYRLDDKEKKYFLKLNNATKYPKMFEQEAKGLEALRNNSSLTVPAVIRHGIVQQSQYLLLEWIENGNIQSDFWEAFGSALALMHRQPQSFFGGQENNYIGSLTQLNAPHLSWHAFYSECRILPLVKLLADAGLFLNKDAANAELLCSRLSAFFPEEPPALLHGDLWSGNFIVAGNGTAAVFDPSVYYGHREMDIGMSKLFGGFGQLFYDAYNETYPLETGWKQRLLLTQLYPLLVHAALFGGHYVVKAKEIINQYI